MYGNDTYLDEDGNRLAIITGPNMAGKSTYMRQVALIVLMAQIGSFVPASYAKIGVVDKIFTRVGASDDLSMGQSTFMVEMMEVASILKEATKNSLVILDEIGRGTSTYDGLSIAWAVAEYIADKEKCGAKTLFATHYHELTELENKLDGVKNYSIAVKEKGEDIIFLRKIVEGGTDESYGVHVARLAGVPQNVTKRANEILRSLERKSVLRDNKSKEKEDKKQVAGQFDMFNYKIAEIAHEIDKIDLNRFNTNRSFEYIDENKRKRENNKKKLKDAYLVQKELYELTEKNRIYDELEEKHKTQTRRIKELLEQCKNAKPEVMQACMKEILLLGTYIKRSANLYFLSQEYEKLPQQELRLTIDELVRAMNSCKIECGAVYLTTKPIASKEVVRLFELLKTVTEMTINELHSLFISVSDQEMNLSVECAADLSPIISSEVTVDKEDGLWLIRTAIGGEDNA